MNTKPFKVSIIIPVYNAEKYIREAVESSLLLEETGEILLIDDGSMDGSLDVCRQLSDEYPIVHVYQHADKNNHGPAATRNVGIKKASCEFVSFLDADDYYLGSRFEVERKVFPSNPDVEVIYGFSLTTFVTEEGKTKYFTKEESEIYTLSEKIPCDRLFKALLFYGYGRLHTSAITIRKTAFEKAGFFNEKLRWAEDTEMWLRLALTVKMVPGNIDSPISHRRIHNSNMVHEHSKANIFKNLMYHELLKWVLRNDGSFETLNNIHNAHWMFTENKELSAQHFFWFRIRQFPQLIYTSFFWKKLYLLYINS